MLDNTTVPRQSGLADLRLVRPLLGFANHELHVDHDEQHPDGGEVERDFHEGISGAGTEGTRTAGAAERSGQPAALAALDQHDEHEEQAENDDDQVHQMRIPGHGNKRHGGASAILRVNGYTTNLDNARIYRYPAAAMILAKASALRLAPPTRPPSTSACENKPAALSGVTEPPYRMGSRLA